MITCPSCTAKNDPSYKFCDACGQQLGVSTATVTSTPTGGTAAGTCPQCGQSVVPGEMFCDNCGASLTANTTVAVPSARQPASPLTAASGTQLSGAAALCRGALLVQGSGARIALPDKAEVLVGREDAPSQHFPDIDLTPYNGEADGVSRRHARISIQNGRMMLEDLDTTNHTYLNKQQLSPKQPQQLHDGDEVRFGRLVTTFRLS